MKNGRWRGKRRQRGKRLTREKRRGKSKHQLVLVDQKGRKNQKKGGLRVNKRKGGELKLPKEKREKQ